MAAEPGALARRRPRSADPQATSSDHDYHAYLRRGEYADQLQRYLDVFEREQLLVLTLDELHEDAAEAFRTCSATSASRTTR